MSLSSPNNTSSSEEVGSPNLSAPVIIHLRLITSPFLPLTVSLNSRVFTDGSARFESTVRGNSARFISSRDIFTGNGLTGVGRFGDTGTAEDSASETSCDEMSSSGVVDVNAEGSFMLLLAAVIRIPDRSGLR